MNKQQITQEEFDKKVESLTDSVLNNPVFVATKAYKKEFIKSEIENLKERYEIK